MPTVQLCPPFSGSFLRRKNWVSCKITVVDAGWGYFPVCPWSNVGNVLLIHVCALNFHMGL